MAAVALTLCVLLSVAGVGVVGDKVYTVVANTSATSCENKTECSLMYYAAHPDQYFREDNTAFFFLPGQHELVNSTLVAMANTTNLSLYGTDVSRVTVVCSGQESGGFSFYNITNLTIRELSVCGCSKSTSYYPTSVAVDIKRSFNVEMDHVSIQNTAGLGLSLGDIYGNSYFTNIEVDFSHSTPNSTGGNLAFYFARYFGNDTAPMNNIIVSDSFFRYGTNDYLSESSSSGIAFQIFCYANISIVLDNLVVSGNQAKSGGNVWINFGSWSSLWSVSISILNSQILNGTAHSGGGICMFAIAGDKGSPVPLESTTTLLNVENTHFESNTAFYDGGALYMRLHQNSQRNLGRIAFDNCTFKRNQVTNASHGGVAAHIVTYALPTYVQHSVIYFELEFSGCKFIESSALHNGSASLPRTGALYTENTPSITLMNCKFIENNCSGIVSIASNFLLYGENEIRGNRAEKGGGIFFCSSSVMHLHNGTQLSITDNSATQSGGGIYVDGECSPAVEFCFFQVDNMTVDNATLHQTQVYVINNTANSGSALYGGLIDWCIIYDERGQKYHKWYPSKIFDNTFEIANGNGKNNFSVISSDPMYVRFCNMTQLEKHNCPLTTSVVVKPGKTFTVSAVIMGQRYGLVSGVVVAGCIDEDCSISNHEYSQFINTSISSGRHLTYTVFSLEYRNVSLKLVAEDFYSGFPSYQYQPSYINVFVEKCPLGFIEQNKMCTCLKGIPCNIATQTIFRSSPHWIGYQKDCCITNPKDIILHSFCPLGYCLDKSVSIHATVDHFYQDVQCSEHRTGILCGECKQNYSLGFGSSQCLAGCSTPHRYLQYLRVIGLSAVCAVAGVLLVVLLTLLNLTVVEGTLNGLIFYANIVQVNLDLFFPSDTHARPWTTFIAWLNLDFGVTVCFYDGMDAYVKTWLQFIFPLYLWIISGGIVYFSRKSRRISRLAGNNSVKVLATLFLLSFGKLTRTVIVAIFFTNIKTYDETIFTSVWRLDANVQYLHGKHITLFIVASLAGIVALLYALLLTFIQCLRRAPNSRLCGWILRLKPLLDAYTGPYNNKYHFWTGFLLLVRIALFVCFALNFDNNPILNFTLIITVSTLLISGIQNGIYYNRFIGLLETSVYTNLILFSAFTMLSVNSSGGHKTAVVCVFGGWAFLTLVGIILYHGYKNLFKDSALFGHLQLLFYERLRASDRNRIVIRSLIIGRGGNDMSQESDSESEKEEELSNQATPQLREPLITIIN